MKPHSSGDLAAWDARRGFAPWSIPRCLVSSRCLVSPRCLGINNIPYHSPKSAQCPIFIICDGLTPPVIISVARRVVPRLRDCIRGRWRRGGGGSESISPLPNAERIPSLHSVTGWAGNPVQDTGNGRATYTLMIWWEFV